MHNPLFFLWQWGNTGNNYKPIIALVFGLRPTRLEYDLQAVFLTEFSIGFHKFLRRVRRLDGGGGNGLVFHDLIL